jgi:tripartite ATP-independent transporter DctM subunit
MPKEMASARPHMTGEDVRSCRKGRPDVFGHAVTSIVEWIVAALVIAEIGILFTGVVSRYAFHRPLVSADELSAIVFVWHSMLGAVVALWRGEHMRMTALVSDAPPRWRSFLESFSLTAVFAFLLLLAGPALRYALSEVLIETPALQISNAWRAGSLPCGICMMLLLCVSKLIAASSRTALVTAACFTVAIVGGLYWLGGIFLTLGNLNLLIFFVGLLASLVFSGVPIAFCFGLATFGYLSLTTTVPLEVVVGTMEEGMSHLVLLSVPMFVFLGLLLDMTGMARSMVLFLANLLGNVRGGLSYVLIAAMYLVSGISGAKAADMAAIAPVLFPEMKKRGARPGDLIALLAATGAQTETIPPSIVLITIGSTTGVSIAALFTGGLLPAFVLGVMLCGVVWVRNWSEEPPSVARPSTREILRSLAVALPSLALPIVIRTAVIQGIATATEVSTIGIFYSAVIGMAFYRNSEWRRLKSMLVETATLSGAILLVIGAATGMAWSLTQSGFSHDLAAFMANLPGGRLTFLLVSMIAFIILGSVLEGIPAIVLFGPLLFPIARQVGVHEVQYAVVVVLAMGVGLFAPPFGVGYYAACAIGKVSPELGMRPMLTYMLALLLGLFLVAFIPWISIGFL